MKKEEAKKMYEDFERMDAHLARVHGIINHPVLTDGMILKYY